MPRPTSRPGRRPQPVVASCSAQPRAWILMRKSASLAQAVAGIGQPIGRSGGRMSCDRRFASGTGLDSSSQRSAEHASTLSPQRFDSGVVGDHQIGTAPLLHRTATGLARGLRTRCATSRAARAARASARHGGVDENDQIAQIVPAGLEQDRRIEHDGRPCSSPGRSSRSIAVEEPGAHQRDEGSPPGRAGPPDRRRRSRPAPADRSPAARRARARLRASTPAPNRATIRPRTRGSFSSSCPTASASITTAPALGQECGDLALAAADSAGQADHRERHRASSAASCAAVRDRSGMDSSTGCSPASEGRPRNRIEPRNRDRSSRAKLRSPRDPSGRSRT